MCFASAVEQFGYHLPHSTFYGGSVAINLKHLMTVNGFPNRFQFNQLERKPLNVITDNVIICLMLSVLQSPIPIGKNSNKIIRLL